MQTHNTSQPVPSSRRSGFTLTELLIVFMIIAILAGMALSALSGASEMARASRTRAIVTKLDQLIMEKWEGYRTRAVPIRNAANMNPRLFANARLRALHELMRMELPDRKSDVTTGCQALSAPPALWSGHNRRAGANWTTPYEGAECLYLIIGSMRDGDQSALDFFTTDEIGDFDGDGMKEILDGWGQPIEFLRWAPGYVVQNDVLTIQTTNSDQSPDPFDPLKVDCYVGMTTNRWSDTDPNKRPYALTPLIYSAGPDKLYSISQGADSAGNAVNYPTPPQPPAPAPQIPPNDPYVDYTGGSKAGFPGTGHEDNITNHYEAP